MTLLVTGATGLIGNEIVSLLLQNGETVHYLTTSKSKIVDQPNYKGFYWDPKQGILDEKCLFGVESIIHLAGATVSKRWTNAYKQEIIESRIDTSNLLFKALKQHPNQVKQIVSASAIGIYQNSLTTLYTEDSKQLGDDFLANVVLKWEESVDKFSLLHLKVCKLRIGLVLSDKGGALSEMIKPIKLGLGSHFGSGMQMQSWIHIKDLANLFYFATQNQLDEVYNAVAPNPVSNKVLVKTIATVLQKPLFFPPVPKLVMKLILGEMHELLFSSQLVSSQKIVDKNFQFQFQEVAPALSNLLRK
ncbi:TIGR01777 family oxidoreductase [Flavobacterium orientale]|uniref:NAD-dependent epimerase n=1 Tax=Flavobacterium orientale TaxID=1756020 RepID=A0A916XWU8_9FLAO|nr:TIGR01777 family oxidoreductase [Flavobacterium orientale]GGD16066.1 NAD-dependent epimerase [Flavobacterium orientale]